MRHCYYRPVEMWGSAYVCNQWIIFPKFMYLDFLNKNFYAVQPKGRDKDLGRDGIGRNILRTRSYLLKFKKRNVLLIYRSDSNLVKLRNP
jgi:hypothetical protein